MTKRTKIIRTIQVLLLLGMLGFGFYPRVADAWNRYAANRRMDTYSTAVNEAEENGELESMREAAEGYNDRLYATGSNHIPEYTERIAEHNAEVRAEAGTTESGSGNADAGGSSDSSSAVSSSESAAVSSDPQDDGLALGTADDADYENTLSLTPDGLMGTLDIEKIDVHLPIYHYTTDEVLSKGIGHLYGSSLPVGGENTHAVLTGHRGLPSMELFTDLDELSAGDTFVINVLGEKLTYEVYRIDIVLPDEMDVLAIEPGEDLVSLLTCTPYGVNTHRLIVTGRRIATAEDTENVSSGTNPVNAPLFIIIAAAAVLAAAVIFLIYVWTRKTLTDAEADAQREEKRTARTAEKEAKRAAKIKEKEAKLSAKTAEREAKRAAKAAEEDAKRAAKASEKEETPKKAEPESASEKPKEADVSRTRKETTGEKAKAQKSQKNVNAGSQNSGKKKSGGKRKKKKNGRRK